MTILDSGLLFWATLYMYGHRSFDARAPFISVRPLSFALPVTQMLLGASLHRQNKIVHDKVEFNNIIPSACD